MKRLTWMLCVLLAGCSSKERESDACTTHDQCPRKYYCAEDGTCEPGCVTDADCDSGTCNLDTHACEGGETDGGTDAGSDEGTRPDTGRDAGSDPGSADPGTAADQDECQPTHDKPLGEACDCDDECAPDNPFCFADVLNDSGPLYCTIPNCTQGSCPAGYECNDFYVNADPPQPPFCQKCLGGPRSMGEECLCDSDCDAASAPDCFKDISDEAALALCTITGCTVGEGDECPGVYECSVSFDITNQENPVTNFCKECDPGDHSIQEGQECGCNKDCVAGAICTKDLLSEEPKTCRMCLGGEPRGFGEECTCDTDCGEEFPVCLINSKYCSVTGCVDNPALCPAGSHCRDLWGFYSFCEKD
jgi:hypothetical protein